MRATSSSQLFLALCSLFFVGISCCYYLAIDTIAIPNRTLDQSYRNFLLEATSTIPNRIIIDSGSNAVHGINGSILEEHFGRLTINMADVGDNPLLHKIYRINNHAKEGDIVLLPLEWNQYFRGNMFGKRYVSSIISPTGGNSFYYRNLPLIEKQKFIFKHLPFELGFKRITELNALEQFNPALRDSNNSSFYQFLNQIELNGRGNNFSRKPNIVALYGTAQTSCDQYIFGDAIKNDFSISKEMISNLKLLQEISDTKKVKIIFLWPSVAGRLDNECYTSAKVASRMAEFTDAIESMVEQHGFSFIGSPNSSRYDKECFFDTYYHIKYKCGIEHTYKLIKELESIGVSANPYYSKMKIQNTLLTFLNTHMPISPITIPMLGTHLEINKLLEHVLFDSGWYGYEDRGLWSKGRHSVFRINTKGLHVNSLKITGSYFNDEEDTKIWINNNYLGAFSLINRELDISSIERTSEYIEVKLEHENPISPMDLGLSNDGRKIKFSLTGISLYGNIN